MDHDLWPITKLDLLDRAPNLHSPHKAENERNNPANLYARYQFGYNIELLII